MRHQQMDIDDLARRLGALRNHSLTIKTADESGPDQDGIRTAAARINGHEVRYQYLMRRTGALERLLRAWPTSVRIDGAELQTGGRTGDEDRIVIMRNALPLAGYHGQTDPHRTLGATKPTVSALGLEFSTPVRPERPDPRTLHLSAPDPDGAWPHLHLRMAATIMARIRISDRAAAECRFRSDDDDPYVEPGPSAKMEIRAQLSSAERRAADRLERETGASGFVAADSWEDAQGSHEALSAGRPVRCCPTPGVSLATMQQNGASTSEQAAAARALYRSSEAGIVPLAGFYGTGARHQIAIAHWEVTELDGRTTTVPKGHEPGPSRRVAAITLEFALLHTEDGERRTVRVQTDLLVSGYGRALTAVVAPPLDEQPGELTRLLAHVCEPYRTYGMPDGEDPEMSAQVTALMALGRHNEAFRVELQEAARNLENSRRSEPTVNEMAVDQGDITLWWQRR